MFSYWYFFQTERSYDLEISLQVEVISFYGSANSHFALFQTNPALPWPTHKTMENNFKSASFHMDNGIKMWNWSYPPTQYHAKLRHPTAQKLLLSPGTELHWITLWWLGCSWWHILPGLQEQARTNAWILTQLMEHFGLWVFRLGIFNLLLFPDGVLLWQEALSPQRCTEMEIVTPTLEVSDIDRLTQSHMTYSNRWNESKSAFKSGSNVL